MEKWDKEEQETAINLLVDGLSYSEIGKILDRTSSSVRCRLIRLGFKFKDQLKIENSCLFCGKDFIPTRYTTKKFCSSSCSAKFNNKHRIYKRKEREKHFCLNCDKEIIRYNNKFCDNKCQGEFHKKEIFSKIENGDLNQTSSMYKNFLVYKYGEKCMECGWNKIHPITKKVPIQLEHIDGNSDNHDLKNLKLLCPNCHSLTLTYGALNKGKGRTVRKIKRNERRNKEKGLGESFKG